MSKMFDYAKAKRDREAREAKKAEKAKEAKRTEKTEDIRREIAKRAKEHPSATRSDRLVMALWKRGLDEEGVAEKLVEATEATRMRRSWKFNKHQLKQEEVEEHIPDWKTRLAALDLITRIHGFIFQMPKDAAVNINMSTLQIAQDVDQMTVDRLMKEYPNAVKTLGEIRPDLVDKIEEAEVVDAG
jgi:hypothetical protein